MKISMKFCVVLALLAAGTAHAQVGTMPNITRAEGTITAMSPTSLTLSGADGKTDVIELLTNWTVTVSKLISIEQIEPGSYVATANKEKPDGTGVSIEIRVSPPGTNGVGVNAVMDPAEKTVMTNGTVSTVVKSVEGRVITVNYGSGVRQITVPLDIPVVQNTPGDRSMVNVGSKVRVVTFAASADRPARQSITVDSKDAK